jgi:ATP adenylyltransferase/5',5'''-P-1,P-4-tetraphosphate phosphorylase II
MIYSDLINELFSCQLREWDLAKQNYTQLEKVRTRKLDFGTFEIFVQFNPERIRSSAAKVDPKSIGERPCFLCSKNRPIEQRGIVFEKTLTILVNPFPIFRRHLTISSEFHTDQRIKNNFDTMLSLAQAMPLYTVFYNGPQCGASAPDHLHFQAGNNGFMPIENDFRNGKHTTLHSSKPGIEIWEWESYLRGIITLKGSDREKLVRVFDRLFERLSDIQQDRLEPMLNILAMHSSGEWILHVIPRKQHRPAQFFAKGNDQILISPAAVDLGGVIITPREEDFNNIRKSDIENIFRQICFEENELNSLLNELL